MRNNYPVSRLSTVIVVLNIVITFFSLFNYQLFSFYAGISIYINSAAIVVALCLNQRKHLNTGDIIYFTVLIYYMAIDILVNSGGVGSVITYAISILTLKLLSTLEFQEKDRQCLRIVAAIIIIGMFFKSFEYRRNFDYYQWHDVNPNTVGMFVLYAFCIFTAINTKKIYNFLLFLISFGAILNAQSRGALLAFIAYTILNLLPRKLFNRKFVVIITIMLTVLGTSVPFVYVNLYKQGFQLEILHKRLFTGREQLWMRAFKYFSDDPKRWFLGIGSRVKLWNYETNVHNCFFGIIVNFGIIGFFLYVIFISKYIKEVGKYTSQDFQIKRWFCVFLSTNIILGFTETSIFWAVIFIFSNLGLSRAFYLSKEKRLQYDS